MEDLRPLLDYPRLFFLVSLLVLWLAAKLGASLHGRRPLNEDEREHFGVVQAATLTLLALIIGFSFSMAISRYDLRKYYEEAEANAIGTEYLRIGLLPAGDAAAARAQLRKYLDLRISFYRSLDVAEIRRIGGDTNQLQSELWRLVEAPARAQQTPVVALAVAGMNDVLNSQGYTQAAWWNRIPTSTWALMAAMAICCNVLVGYGMRAAESKAGLLIVLPMVLSLSFLLIADIDSPRHGFIHVTPENLVSLSRQLPTQ